MTKKELFVVIIRAIALGHLVISVIDFLPMIGLYFGSWEKDFFIGLGISNALYIGILIYLLLRTETIVKFLKIDKGYDDDRLQFGKMNEKGFVKVAVSFLGVYLIISSIPRFMSLLFYWFKDSIPKKTLDIFITQSFEPTFLDVNRIDLLELSLKVIFGFLLVRNSSRVADKLLVHREIKQNPEILDDH